VKVTLCPCASWLPFVGDIFPVAKTLMKCDASRDVGLEVKKQKTNYYMFMSCLQNDNIKIASKSFKNVIVQIFKSSSNKSKLHSRKLKSRLNSGMLAVIQFRIFGLPTSYVKP
jgi:hypothetical protein